MSKVTPSLLTRTLTLGLTWGTLTGSLLLLTAAKSPEQETLEVSRLLKPIADERWKEIAKDQLNQDYEVIRGDTLWGVSQRLFGEGNYWPKVWALNGQSIPNPHWIRPGMKLVFTPGTGTSLPALALADASGVSETNSRSSDTATDAPRSQEWRNLPIQSWEQVQLLPPTEFDPQGFDTKIRLQSNPSRGLTAPQIVQTTQLPVMGTIGTAGSRNFSLTQGEKVFLLPGESDSFRPGQILTITGRPNLLKSPQSGREGWVYPVEGLLRVVGQKQPEPLGVGLEAPADEQVPSSSEQLAPSGGIWVGEIIASVSSAVRTSSILVDLPVQFQTPPVLAAPASIKAILMIDRSSTVSVMAQHQVAFIDRGNEDGVRPGMVFRAYLDRDLHSLDPIGSDNLVSIADCRVLHVTERFSTVLISSSSELILDGTTVTALTDVSEFFKKGGRAIKDFDGNLQPTNELDGLEEPSELTEEEKKNLLQLEKKEEETQGEVPAEEAPPSSTETPPNLEETPTAPAPDMDAPVEAPAEPTADSPAETETPTDSGSGETTAPLEPEAPSEPSPEAPPDF